MLLVVPPFDAPIGGGRVNWRRNLAALWVAEFTAIFGFSFALPFLPVYLKQDLGVHGTQALALWSGLVGGGSGIGLMLTSPIWGMLADRHGRKPMLLRAIVGAALTVGLMGIVRSAPQLFALRVLQGTTSGTVSAATALAAAETPRSRMAWAMGVLNSSVALGSTLAPAIGGVAALLVGLRWTFLVGGGLLALSAIPVLLVVRESPRAPHDPSAPRARLRSVDPAALRALGVLVGGQALMQFAYFATQQLAALHILSLSPGHATAFTGLAFGVAGGTTTLAALTYPRLTGRLGYRWVAVLASCLFAVSIAAVGSAGTIAPVVAAFAAYGLAYGALSPALAAMIGLQAPRAVQATVFGISASALAVGVALGPVTSGVVAAVTNVSTGLYAAGAVALVLALFLAILARDPKT